MDDALSARSYNGSVGSLSEGLEVNKFPAHLEIDPLASAWRALAETSGLEVNPVKYGSLTIGYVSELESAYLELGSGLAPQVQLGTEEKEAMHESHDVKTYLKRCFRREKKLILTVIAVLGILMAVAITIPLILRQPGKRVKYSIPLCLCIRRSLLIVV